MEFLRWLGSIAFSLGGLSLLSSIVALVLLLVFARVFGALPEWARNVLIVIAIAGALGAFGYGKGRADERAFYKDKLAREIKHAVAKGDAARARALAKFDSSVDLPDDGFARDDDD